MVTPMLRVTKTLFWSTNPFIIFSKKRKTSTNKSPVNYDQKERKKKKKKSKRVYPSLSAVVWRLG